MMIPTNKCPQCGLVGFPADNACRRCGALLPGVVVLESLDAAPGGRSFGRWLIWLAGTTTAILLTAYLSLIVTSSGLDADQRLMVDEAIAILEESGFDREVRALRTFVAFRSTDHWWNEYVGHQSAYAATNYPFGVITLYAPFFRVAADGTERAAILLHEAHHVFGAEEEAALRRVWLEKGRIGWTAARYGGTRVWKNTREWTEDTVPALFRCGMDGQSDCLE